MGCSSRILINLDEKTMNIYSFKEKILEFSVLVDQKINTIEFFWDYFRY